MRPRQGNKWLRQLGLVALLVCALATPSARAETPIPSTAAQIAHAEFLPYMDPPPGEPASVCLVDTGVDLNPDTASTVTERVALDGGDPGDVWDRKHGTEMAMVMGAPINNWGTVGAWPLVRIVSVRAMAPGATSFPFSAYARSILACLKRPSVKVINLSFSGVRPGDAEMREFEDMALTARASNVSLVAGSGNGGGAIGYPAAFDSVFAVGASASGGVVCAFSAGGSELTRAPGCGLQLADPRTGEPLVFGGTSPAAAFTASVVAALRSYVPSLNGNEAESLLRATAGHGNLDVAAAFRAAGLSAAVDAAQRAARNDSAKVAPSTSSSDEMDMSALDRQWAWPTPRAEPSRLPRWPTPRASSICTKRHALVRVVNRPKLASLVVSLGGRHEFGLGGHEYTARSSRIQVSRAAWASLLFVGTGRVQSRQRRIPLCRPGA